TQPMPDDTGQYGIYSEAAFGANAQAQYGNHDAYSGYDQQQGQQGQQGQYDYGTAGQQQYGSSRATVSAARSDQ
ncbi:hypothetical protein J0695_39185, partial [Streptomyces beijiangensis]|nr:hypothetical protein [Streptomyces beijiangensis]